jgi:hypothetical protein
LHDEIDDERRELQQVAQEKIEEIREYVHAEIVPLLPEFLHLLHDLSFNAALEKLEHKGQLGVDDEIIICHLKRAADALALRGRVEVERVAVPALFVYLGFVAEL